ncbi:MAG: peptidoglycan editing factor PgeF [Chloroflexia bacterium]|nr:peptidoglycan editing factor PgeF [Chloroflexia bacterium]
MKKKALNKISLYRFEQFSKFSSVQHFITCKNNIGNNQFTMSLSSVKEPNPIIENRKLLADALGLTPENFVFHQQEHTKNVTVVKKVHGGKGFYIYDEGFADNDAMITNEKNLCLMIMGADCVPILLYDPINGIIGAAHAGWRGTVQSIASTTVKAMQNKFGCRPSDLVAGIGPSIGPQNYEVDQVVYDKFSKSFDYCHELFTNGKKAGKYQLDLWKANKIQLLNAGLRDENIEVSEICTFENNEDFFSARKGDSGRFASGIMLV